MITVWTKPWRPWADGRAIGGFGVAVAGDDALAGLVGGQVAQL